MKLMRIRKNSILIFNRDKIVNQIVIIMNSPQIEGTIRVCSLVMRERRENSSKGKEG